MMKHTGCTDKNIKEMLVDYVSGELPPARAGHVEAHVKTCRHCREEYLLMQRLQQESLRLDNECDKEMQAIDWEETARAISDAVPFKHYRPAGSRGFSFLFNWKLAVPLLTGVFLLGIWLGYLLFHVSPRSLLPAAKEAPGDVSLARMENSLAKREVSRYFKQSQLVLTDLLEQCSVDSSFSWQNQVDIKRVKTLLSKNRYFSRNLDGPELLGSKKLLKKIEWLLYEILMASGDTSCRDLQRLQDYIKQERLLLKIRLIGKELSFDEV